jgi:metallo-beta-lactamase family protein
MHGIDVPVRAPFISVEGLSAHADKNELVRWLRSGKELPEQVVLVHGEPAAAEALSQQVELLGIRAMIPQLGDSLTLGEHPSSH